MIKDKGYDEMKRKWKMLTALTAGLILSSVAWIGVVQAQTAPTDSKGVINNSIYRAGKTVTINGTINGDVYCAGQNVTIKATVNGDVLCAGETVTVEGDVKGSVRVAAQTVTLNAKIGHAVSAFGEVITINNGAVIAQDATLAGSTTNINGKVGRDAVIASGEAILMGTVGRNVTFDGGTFAVNGDGKIDGNLTYTSSQDAQVTKAQVAGSIDHNAPKQEKPSRTMFAGMNAQLFIFFLLATVVFALVMVLIFPQAFHKVSSYAVNSLGKTVLVGFLAAIALPIAMMATALSLVGIPLALFIFLIWLVLIMLATPVTAYYLGSMILAKSKQPVLMMLVGVIVLCILFYLPILGIIAMFMTHWIGVGAILRACKERLPKPVYKVGA